MDDWSDSDEEGLSGVETSVLLGVPDGAIDVATDLTDAAVSRIGGHPAFLSSPEPPITSCYCKVCENPMELLVQLWCPFENSPMDRALYVWGCARTSCQRKQGSVRAWRGFRYNEEYAAKLARAKTNTASSAPVKLGTLIFGEGAESAESDNESEESLVTAMTKAVVADSAWGSAPAYAPVYLSTVSEYLPPQPKTRVPAGTQVTDAGEAGGEKYENSLDVDAMFARFARRVAAEVQGRWVKEWRGVRNAGRSGCLSAR
ncbi:hypothetical protein APHAL10511_002180 [Amanita phalloides]|nr:hypothetical protein APHAL10511_002180 [Amanita phalloides]